MEVHSTSLPTEFQFDVFFSHSWKDKKAVRAIARRLRGDGLRVWFQDWMIKPGTTKASRLQMVEEGLEQSRVLVLCMSANAFGSVWVTLEKQTFRFRDPLNEERRFIPLRLDESPIHDAMAPFMYINWLRKNREEEYEKLREICWPPRLKGVAPGKIAEEVIRLKSGGPLIAFSLSADERCVLSGSEDGHLRLWNRNDGEILFDFKHTDSIWGVAWGDDQRYVLSCGRNEIVCMLNTENGSLLRVFEGHTGPVRDVVWSINQRHIISGSFDNSIRVWDAETGACVQILEGHRRFVFSIAVGADPHRALSGGDRTLRLWDLEKGQCLRIFKGHTGFVYTVSLSSDQRLGMSGSEDKTVRLWDLEAGQCLRVFEGHTGSVWSIAWNVDQRFALSSSLDKTVRLWDTETGHCLCVLRGHESAVVKVLWAADQHHALSFDSSGEIRMWDLLEFVRVDVPAPLSTGLLPASDQVQYTNAKVLLVGESGVGKTGLSKRLALDHWQPSDSTVGAWATQWKLPVSSGDSIEREIWLWDFGGQADQRLIHQLYMDETALTVLVFDGQKEDLFETLGQWDRDLTRASHQGFSKLLVAGRVDAGGLRVSRAQLEAFKDERGYLQLLETSAKANLGCEELKQAILAGIRWEDIPWRSSPLLFKRLKEEIVRLKDEGRVLMRFNELRESLALRLSDEDVRFSDEELKAVVSLLAGPGVVWELKFGSWVLLHPEIINAYAQAVIQTMRADEHERGCLPEERVLSGDLKYHSSMARLEADEERFVLLAMHQILVERGLCLREHTDKGALLVFPSYYRRERPELVGHPAVLVSYRFNGFLDDVYATLVVRLHHTEPIRQDQLWRYAADFKTLTGKQLGVKLTRRAEGAGELEVYFDPMIPLEEKIIFSKYVHEHLLQNGRDVERLRHYVCPHCGTPVGNREVAMRKLEEGKRDIPCVDCEMRIPLWDPLEELFASSTTKQRVRELQEQSTIVLDAESKERALVGDVISTVALAGQIKPRVQCE